MKKLFALTFIILGLLPTLSAQDMSAKDKADALAKNEFSKAKHEKKEKYGVAKEKNKVILSTPVINNNPSFYQGNYVVQGLNYQLEIRQDPQNVWLVTLTMDNDKTVLKNVVINDAYFTATKTGKDGTEEVWEGAFINKSDDGVVDFGLGIKLSTPVRFQSINMTKLFFKKVSP